jgi:hypothetical protein
MARFGLVIAFMEQLQAVKVKLTLQQAVEAYRVVRC